MGVGGAPRHDDGHVPACAAREPHPTILFPPMSKCSPLKAKVGSETASHLPTSPAVSEKPARQQSPLKSISCSPWWRSKGSSSLSKDSLVRLETLPKCCGTPRRPSTQKYKEARPEPGPDARLQQAHGRVPTRQRARRRWSPTTVRGGRAAARETPERGDNQTSSSQAETTATVHARGPPPTAAQPRARPRPGRARLPEARPTQLAHETPGPRRHPAATTDGSETELTGLPLNLPAVTPLPGGHLTPP